MNQDQRIQILFERFRYEDETLGQRTDWFLIFHAILLEAFLGASGMPRYQIPIAAFGLMSAYLWVTVGIRQWWDHKHLQMVLEDSRLMTKEFATIFKGISKVRLENQPSWFRWARATPSFAIVIPAGATVLWFYNAVWSITDLVPIDPHYDVQISGLEIFMVMVLLALVLPTMLVCALGVRPELDTRLVDPLVLNETPPNNPGATAGPTAQSKVRRKSVWENER